MTQILALESVEYRYGQGSVVLSEISFEVKYGERIAILGANGCGKSTLMRLLDGLTFPTSGSYTAFGEPVTEEDFGDPVKARRFRQRAGFVFQNADAMLFNSSVYDELAFGPGQVGLTKSEVEQRVNDIAQLTQVTHLLQRAPFQLSGGEKRRVALAAMLTLNPDLLLLDEPTTGLDPRSQLWLVTLLEMLHKAGKTHIITTHDLGLVRHIADRIIILGEDHRIAADGTTEAVLADVDLLERVNLIHRDLRV